MCSNKESLLTTSNCGNNTFTSFAQVHKPPPPQTQPQQHNRMWDSVLRFAFLLLSTLRFLLFASGMTMPTTYLRAAISQETYLLPFGVQSMVLVSIIQAALHIRSYTSAWYHTQAPFYVDLTPTPLQQNTQTCSPSPILERRYLQRQQ